MSKRAREMDATLRAMGFVLHRQGRHPIYRHPGGGPQLVAPSTPSDARGWKNALADARRIVRALEVA